MDSDLGGVVRRSYWPWQTNWSSHWIKANSMTSPSLTSARRSIAYSMNAPSSSWSTMTPRGGHSAGYELSWHTDHKELQWREFHQNQPMSRVVCLKAACWGLYSSFLIFINDLPASVRSSSMLFVVYREIRSTEDCQILQDDLQQLWEWEMRQDMSFHPEKCSILRVHRKRSPVVFDYSLKAEQWKKKAPWAFCDAI